MHMTHLRRTVQMKPAGTTLLTLQEAQLSLTNRTTLHFTSSQVGGDARRISRICIYVTPFDPSARGSPRAIGFVLSTEKLEWLGYNLVNVAPHDDRLSHFDTIHQRDGHTDSHVAIANAAPTHCVGRQVRFIPFADKRVGGRQNCEIPRQHVPCLSTFATRFGHEEAVCRVSFMRQLFRQMFFDFIICVMF